MTIHHGVDNPYELMIRSDIAIVSYGMTALECLAAGLPTIALSMSNDHLASAQALSEHTKAFISAGLTRQVNMRDLTRTAYCLATYSDNVKSKLRRQARKAVDGHGVENVAAKIMEVLS